jgi:hypothetical protein
VVDDPIFQLPGVIGTHHIVSDNWSWTVLLAELDALYRELVGGAPADLPDLPVQFADFAAWQRAWLRGEAAGRHVAYWRSRLAGAPPLLALPTDRPRPRVRSDHAERVGHRFATGVGQRLRALAGTEGATLASALLAAFAALLRRCGGPDDLVLGSPTAGRHRPELEHLVGYFADILPLRLDLTGAPTLRELIRRVHASVVNDYAHQALPFSAILAAVGPPRDPGYHPITQCLCNVVDLPGARRPWVTCGCVVGGTVGRRDFIVPHAVLAGHGWTRRWTSAPTCSRRRRQPAAGRSRSLLVAGSPRRTCRSTGSTWRAAGRRRG